MSCPFRCDNFRGHAPRSRRPGAAGHADYVAIYLLHDLDKLAFPEPWIPVEQAFRVGENDQQVGAGEVYHHGCQKVVVTVTDLLHRDGVVLIDDRNRAHFEQSLQCILGKNEPAAVLEALTREQDLTHMLTMTGKGGSISLDKAALTHSCQGLFDLHGAGRLLVSHGLHPHENGSRADYNKVTLAVHGSHFIRQAV